MNESAFSALRHIGALGGRVAIERRFGDRIRATPFAEDHGGPPGLGALTARGLVALVPSQDLAGIFDEPLEYELTDSGKRALADIFEEVAP